MPSSGYVNHSVHLGRCVFFFFVSLVLWFMGFKTFSCSLSSEKEVFLLVEVVIAVEERLPKKGICCAVSQTCKIPT